MISDRELPRGDRAEEPDPPAPRAPETFSEKLRRLAHELHGMPLDAPGPVKAWPRGGLQGNARTDAILRGENPDEREPGSDDA